MAKANLDKLNALHAALADYYAELLDPDSMEELSSGTLAAINAFLKNNNITADIVESDSMQNLGMTLRSMIKESEEVS